MVIKVVKNIKKSPFIKDDDIKYIQTKGSYLELKSLRLSDLIHFSSICRSESQLKEYQKMSESHPESLVEYELESLCEDSCKNYSKNIKSSSDWKSIFDQMLKKSSQGCTADILWGSVKQKLITQGCKILEENFCADTHQTFNSTFKFNIRLISDMEFINDQLCEIFIKLVSNLVEYDLSKEDFDRQKQANIDLVASSNYDHLFLHRTSLLFARFKNMEDEIEYRIVKINNSLESNNTIYVLNDNGQTVDIIR